MQTADAGYLRDIVTAARPVQALVEGFDLEAFRTDVRTHSAVFYQLAVVGEATRKLSPEFRESITEIPWRRIAGMRDILIHGYRGVSPTEAWKAATISIPELLAALAPVLPAIDLHE